MESISDEQLKNADILIVESMIDSLEVLTKILRENEYGIRTACSAETAISLIKNKIPDIILLSAHIIGENSFEVCRRIKAIPETHKIIVDDLNRLSLELDYLKPQTWSFVKNSFILNTTGELESLTISHYMHANTTCQRDIGRFTIGKIRKTITQEILKLSV